MATLYILPHTCLELRPAVSDMTPRYGPFWELAIRDSEARRLWAVKLSTLALVALLERLVQGGVEASTSGVKVNIYPDPETEASVAAWASQQLLRHAKSFAQAQAVMGLAPSVESVELRRVS
jgi:hypothetical protein